MKQSRILVPFLTACVLIPVPALLSHASHRVLDANNIRILLNNVGDLPYPTGNETITTWSVLDPEQTAIVFAQGIWLAGKADGEPRVSLAVGNSVYSPGPLLDGRAAMAAAPGDSGRYRAYKIAHGDGPSNPDYAEWPFDFGAPADEAGKPRLYGDQTVWTVFNAFDAANRWRGDWLSFCEPMPIEIQQTAFAKKGRGRLNRDPYSNAVFFEWTLINKGAARIDSMFFGLWTDIDFYEAMRNLPGIDTVFQTGYCWDDGRGDWPRPGPSPALGYVLLHGPSVPAPGQTALFRGRPRPDHANLPITAFHPIYDDNFRPEMPGYAVMGLPRDAGQVWNTARGLDLYGRPYLDPNTVWYDTLHPGEPGNEGPGAVEDSVVTHGESTRFPFSGDPVLRTGWVYPEDWSVGGMSGFVLFSGPFTLAAGDTQWVMAALSPALGETNRLSVAALRGQALALRNEPYDSLISGRPWFPNSDPEDGAVPTVYGLFQNYPNPFNAGTWVVAELPVRAPLSVEVFDVTGRRVAVLAEGEREAGRHRFRFEPRGLGAGVYFARMKSGAVQAVRKMVFLK